MCSFSVFADSYRGLSYIEYITKLTPHAYNEFHLLVWYNMSHAWNYYAIPVVPFNFPPLPGKCPLRLVCIASPLTRAKGLSRGSMDDQLLATVLMMTYCVMCPVCRHWESAIAIHVRRNCSREERCERIQQEGLRESVGLSDMLRVHSRLLVP